MSTIRIRATGAVGAYCDCGYRLGEAWGPAISGEGPRYAVSLGRSWHIAAGGGPRVWVKSDRTHAPGPNASPYRGSTKPVQSFDRVRCPKCGQELDPPR